MASLELTPRGAVMNTPDDISLLSAIAIHRDRAAFTELVERHRERAYNMAFHILRNSALAEEALQEAMLTIWLDAKKLEPEANAANWILRIVSGKSLNLKRSRTRSAKREDRMTTERGRSNSAAEDTAERTELIGALRSQLGKLPELESQLLACSFGANMSHRQIGEIFNLSQPTVGSKIQQALARLRAGLTSSGVAAVIPLVSAENLFEAITTGHPCPPGAAARVLQHVDNAGRVAGKALSRRAAIKAAGTWGAGKLAIVAGIFLLTGAAATAWVVSAKPATPVGANKPLAAQSGDTGWIPVNADLSAKMHGTFNGSRQLQEFNRFASSQGGGAEWKIEQSPSGTKLAQTNSKMPDHNVLMFSQNVSGPTEWSATLDDTNAGANAEVALVVTDSEQGLIFGGHTVKHKQSPYRILAWNVPEGIKLVVIRDDSISTLNWGTATIKSGKFNLGIMTNSLLELRDFKMRSLPADWTPNKDPFLGKADKAD